MTTRMKLFAFCLLIIGGCSSANQFSSTNLNDFPKNQAHIGIQFNDKNACCIDTRGCEGIWYTDNGSVYLTGLKILKDSLGTVEQVNISIEGVDLNSIDYPYIVSAERDEEAIIGWYNEAEVIREKNLCANSENACEYQGDLKRDKVRLVLTSFSNNVLEGKFEGRIYLKGTGKLRFVKTSEYKDIADGSFRLALKKERNETDKNLVADRR